MKLIPLTQGYSAMVDDDDYERVMQFKWHVRKSNAKIPYAAMGRWIPGVGNTLVTMHTFIIGYDKPDHRDGNGLNNQKSNLRRATHAQNCYNKSGWRKRLHRFKGLSRKANGKKRWVARIEVNGRTINLGVFKEDFDAAQAYNFAAAEYFGEFAWFNTPLPQ